MGSESDPAHPEGYLWDGFLCCAEHGACFCWEGTKHTLGRPLGGAQQHLLFYKLCPAYKRWVFLTSEGWGVILQHGPSSVLKTLEMRVQKGDLSRALWSSVPSVWGSWQIQPHLKQSLLLVPRVVGSCNMTISEKLHLVIWQHVEGSISTPQELEGGQLQRVLGKCSELLDLGWKNKSARVFFSCFWKIIYLFIYFYLNWFQNMDVQVFFLKNTHYFVTVKISFLWIFRYPKFDFGLISPVFSSLK